MIYAESGHEVYKKVFHWQVKRPSDIAFYCPNRFGLTILWPDIVSMGT